MRTYILGPFLSLLPKRWRKSFLFDLSINWARAAAISGAVPEHYKDGIAPPFNPAFGTPRTVLSPRQFQFAAKLLF
jgi:hypothetical protein